MLIVEAEEGCKYTTLLTLGADLRFFKGGTVLRKLHQVNARLGALGSFSWLLVTG